MMIDYLDYDPIYFSFEIATKPYYIGEEIKK